MDIFDQYIFDELVAEYEKEGLSFEEYEELYQRFNNLSHLDEVKPYLYVMRFYGLGVDRNQNEVLDELKTFLNTNDIILNGIYYDLLLSLDENNNAYLLKLKQLVEQGYSDKYTKEKSFVCYVDEIEEVKEIINGEEVDNIIRANDKVQVDYIKFECKEYNGWVFTSGDVDYINAKVFIKPIKGKKHIRVSSQLFLNGEPFSRVFYNEYDIDSTTRWLKTQGWGNKNCNCYGNSKYKWVIDIDGETTFSDEFTVYQGNIDKKGPVITDMKLFASKQSGALAEDKENYSNVFSQAKLESVYFKFFCQKPGKNMIVQVFVKVTFLEDNTIFRNKYFVHKLDDNTIAFWNGVGYAKTGQWKKGLYRYSVYVGKSEKFEGTFSVC